MVCKVQAKAFMVKVILFVSIENLPEGAKGIVKTISNANFLYNRIEYGKCAINTFEEHGGGIGDNGDVNNCPIS